MKGAGSFADLNLPLMLTGASKQQDRHAGSAISVARCRDGVPGSAPSTHLFWEVSPHPHPPQGKAAGASPAAQMAPRASSPNEPNQEPSQRGSDERRARLGVGRILTLGWVKTDGTGRHLPDLCCSYHASSLNAHGVGSRGSCRVVVNSPTHPGLESCWDSGARAFS